jgi:hypothetical protein
MVLGWRLFKQRRKHLPRSTRRRGVTPVSTPRSRTHAHAHTRTERGTNQSNQSSSCQPDSRSVARVCDAFAHPRASLPRATTHAKTTHAKTTSSRRGSTTTTTTEVCGRRARARGGCDETLVTRGCFCGLGFRPWLRTRARQITTDYDDDDDDDDDEGKHGCTRDDHRARDSDDASASASDSARARDARDEELFERTLAAVARVRCGRRRTPRGDEIAGDER